MATVKFYKKFSPGTAVVIAGGFRIIFQSFNGVIGYHSTAEEHIQNEFLRLMRAEKFGISEIAYDEFDSEYVKKKASGMQRNQHQREELSPSTMASFLRPKSDTAVAGVAVGVERKSEVASIESPANTTPSAPLQADFQPKTGKRRKANVVPTT
jgi:hypothetical protein